MVLKRSDHLKISLFFLAVVVVLLAGFFYFRSRQTSQVLPKINDGLENCQVKKEGNPLVESPGNFKGVIQTISFNSSNTEADIQLTSAVGKQTHIFKVKAENGLAVFNPKTKKDLLLTDLRSGQTVTLTSSCAQNQDSLFKIITIAVN